jgi:hydrogenase maturation protease
MTGADGARTLVAGIGNIFLADDGFGVEAVKAIDRGALPPGVDVADYGIRGVHLAYELLGGRYDALVMIDAIPLGDAPGTLAVLDVSGYAGRGEFAEWAGTAVDAHSMQPEAVLAALHNLGGAIERVYVVGCQPAALDEGIGLTAAVAAAIPAAVALVLELVATGAAPPEAAAASPPGAIPATRAAAAPAAASGAPPAAAAGAAPAAASGRARTSPQENFS